MKGGMFQHGTPEDCGHWYLRHLSRQGASPDNDMTSIHQCDSTYCHQGALLLLTYTPSINPAKREDRTTLVVSGGVGSGTKKMSFCGLSSRNKKGKRQNTDIGGAGGEGAAFRFLSPCSVTHVVTTCQYHYPATCQTKLQDQRGSHLQAKHKQPITIATSTETISNGKHRVLCSNRKLRVTAQPIGSLLSFTLIWNRKCNLFGRCCVFGVDGFSVWWHDLIVVRVMLLFLLFLGIRFVV